MNKISEHHLARIAYVYIRQSTLHQVKYNLESQRIQYGLVHRAKELGWQDIIVIDDDLGVSGTGKVKRHGFEKMLSEICSGRVGAILAMDASRLARNGREWHTLLEMCALVKTIIIDLEAVYDPGTINDRLLLGMRGTLSEMEISLFRQRSEYALREKAKRGELYTTVAIGYLLIEGQLEKDPDKRIQAAILLVFNKFKELGSVRQVLLWFRQEEIEFPTVSYEAGRREVYWRFPVYNTILRILTNPIYAGSYAYGKTITEVKMVNSIKKLIKGKRLERENWSVLLHGHHENYISWDEYEYNQNLIKNNANMKGVMVRGSVKKGAALLTGLIRCGHCGRKMLVHYNDSRAIRYQCKGAMINHGTALCISFGGLRVDEAISHAVLHAISPLGIEAAWEAITELEKKEHDIKTHHELALQAATFEAERIRRQYDAIEPENRLVASELEKRWNQALTKVNQLEKNLVHLPTQIPSLTQTEKDDLLTLGQNIEKIWLSKSTPVDLKKQMVRILLKEIIAKVENDKIKLTLHWFGGDHTVLEILKNKRGHHRWITDKDTTYLIQVLARYMPDKQIALTLTRLGKHTAKGYTWKEARVRTFRNDHGITAYQLNEHHVRQELLLSEVSERLNLSAKSIIRLVKKNILSATQVCKGAPWIFKEQEVVALAVQRKQWGDKIPLPLHTGQQTLNFSTT